MITEDFAPLDAQRFGRLVPGPISASERAYFYHLARNVYSYTGDFVELGPFLGASTQAFAQGLMDNPARDKRRKMKSYDLFFYDGSWGKGDSFGLSPNEDFFETYKDNIKAYRDHVEPVQGNIMDTADYPDDIEILFIDLAKTAAVFEHVVRVFYPKVTAGDLIVHQDYLARPMPWIKAFHESFDDHFDILWPDANCTVSFRLRKRFDVGKEALDAYFSQQPAAYARLIEMNARRYPEKYADRFAFSQRMYRDRG